VVKAMARALTPDGLCRGRKTVAAKTEAGIYQALDLQYIEPELREGLDVRRTLPRPAHLVIEIQRVRDQTVAMGTDQTDRTRRKSTVRATAATCAFTKLRPSSRASTKAIIDARLSQCCAQHDGIAAGARLHPRAGYVICSVAVAADLQHRRGAELRPLGVIAGRDFNED
jgi:hypothetical protein